MSSSIKTFEHIPCKLFIWENLVTQEFCSSLPSQTEAKKIPILFHDFLIKLCSFSGANHHLRPSKTPLEFFIFLNWDSLHARLNSHYQFHNPRQKEPVSRNRIITIMSFFINSRTKSLRSKLNSLFLLEVRGDIEDLFCVTWF